MELIKYKEVNKGYLKGYADFFIENWELEIYGCGVFSKEGRNWVAMPSREYKDADGKTKYFPIVKFRNKHHHDAFADMALRTIEPHLKKQQQQTQEEFDGLPF